MWNGQEFPNYESLKITVVTADIVFLLHEILVDKGKEFTILNCLQQTFLENADVETLVQKHCVVTGDKSWLVAAVEDGEERNFSPAKQCNHYHHHNHFYLLQSEPRVLPYPILLWFVVSLSEQWPEQGSKLKGLIIPLSPPLQTHVWRINIISVLFVVTSHQDWLNSCVTGGLKIRKEWRQSEKLRAPDL